MQRSLPVDLAVSYSSCRPGASANKGPQELDEVDAWVGRSSDLPKSTLEVAKDAALVTLRFTKTLLQRLPDVADGNPVKVALGIAKLILDIRDVGNIHLI